MNRRKKRSAALKAKVAIAAIKGQKTANELATEFDVHPSQVAKWKKQALDSMSDVFHTGKRTTEEDHLKTMATLYEQIGRLKVELDWIKKKSGFTT